MTPMTCQENVEGEVGSKGIVPTWLFSLRIYFKMYFSPPNSHSRLSLHWLLRSTGGASTCFRHRLSEFATWLHAHHFRSVAKPLFVAKAPHEPHCELSLTVIYKASKGL